MQGYNAECFAVEVGSRGLIVEGELQQLKDALGAPARAMTELAGSLSRTAMLGYFKIWCSRNVQQLLSHTIKLSLHFRPSILF